LSDAWPLVPFAANAPAITSLLSRAQISGNFIFRLEVITPKFFLAEKILQYFTGRCDWITSLNTKVFCQFLEAVVKLMQIASFPVNFTICPGGFRF
jgi:hypothetical protein